MEKKDYPKSWGGEGPEPDQIVDIKIPTKAMFWGWWHGDCTIHATEVLAAIGRISYAEARERLRQEFGLYDEC